MKSAARVWIVIKVDSKDWGNRRQKRALRDTTIDRQGVPNISQPIWYCASLGHLWFNICPEPLRTIIWYCSCYTIHWLHGMFTKWLNWMKYLDSYMKSSRGYGQISMCELSTKCNSNGSVWICQSAIFTFEHVPNVIGIQKHHHPDSWMIESLFVQQN